MPHFVSRLTSRGVATVAACALAAVVTLGAPNQARAADVSWAAVAVGVVLFGIVAGGGKKKAKYEVIARYCENPKTGLYHRC